jgi:hypothetical protein
VPGITLSPARARGRNFTRISLTRTLGRCDPTIYVDGVRLLEQGAPLDDVVDAETVAGIEVYASSAGAPPMYADTRGCGSILFWTRTGEPSDRPFSWKRLGFGAAGVLVLILLAR